MTDPTDSVYLIQPILRKIEGFVCMAICLPIYLQLSFNRLRSKNFGLTSRKHLRVKITSTMLYLYSKKQDWWGTVKPEDHWSCIAHLSAEDMLKSAVIEEKKFKNIESGLIGPRSMNDLDLCFL